MVAPRLRKLAIADCWFGAQALRTLAVNPLCRSVVELDLVNVKNYEPGEATYEAAAALAAIELPQLRRIRLRGSWFAEVWAAGIAARAPQIESIER